MGDVLASLKQAVVHSDHIAFEVVSFPSFRGRMTKRFVGVPAFEMVPEVVGMVQMEVFVTRDPKTTSVDSLPEKRVAPHVLSHVLPSCHRDSFKEGANILIDSRDC